MVSNGNGVCLMYAPANTTYSDNTGSYVFEQACPMEQTTLALRVTPLRRGELYSATVRTQFPSAEGWRAEHDRVVGEFKKYPLVNLNMLFAGD